MIETVLFDIDNTMILFDETQFIKAYISKLTPHFMDLFTPAQFYERLMGATRALLDNKGQMSNADFYMNHLTKGMENNRQDIWNRFIGFYESEFNSLSTFVRPVNHVVSTMETLHQLGMKLIIASNPFWPLMVQEMRLTWACVGHIPFPHITHIENTSTCKPQRAYYEEICENMNIQPAHCLMAGNDPVNDMIAGSIGMTTYLTTDAIDQGFSAISLSDEIRSQIPSVMPKPDFKGTLSELPGMLECQKS